MREAQEDLHRRADGALELAHRFQVADLEPVHRDGELVRHREQRGAVEVRDQEQQEVLVPELPEHAGFAAGEEIVVLPADHREQLPGADEARVAGKQVAGPSPESVVAVFGLEALERLGGVGQ